MTYTKEIHKRIGYMKGRISNEIMQLLKKHKELNVTTIMIHLRAYEQSRLSVELNKLYRINLLSKRRVGKEVYYRINDKTEGILNTMHTLAFQMGIKNG